MERIRSKWLLLLIMLLLLLLLLLAATHGHARLLRSFTENRGNDGAVRGMDSTKYRFFLLMTP